MAARCCPRCCKWLRRCGKCIKRNLRVLFSPQKMFTVSTMFLDGWVNQRTLLIFTLLEMLISIIAFAFICTFREISELGWFLKHWLSYLMILCFRSCCGAVGFLGACCRKVRIMRFYFGSLVMNIPLTFFVVVPFWSCNCPANCEEHDFSSPQCKVLKHFLDDSHMAPWQPQAQASSSSFSVAFALADTLGRATATPTRALRGEATGSGGRQTGMQDMLARLRYSFFGVDLAQQACGNAPCHSGNATSHMVAAPTRHLQRVSDSSSPDADIPHAADSERIFNIYHATMSEIGWKGARKECSFSEVIPECYGAKALLVKLRRRAPTAELLMGPSRRWALLFTEYLYQCLKEEFCGVVEASLRPIKLGEHDHEFQICLHYLPAHPERIERADSNHEYAFLEKDVNVVLNSDHSFAEYVNDSQDKCYASVTFIMVSLAIMDILSLPMFIIVFKFLSRHCGDCSLEQPQFPVEFSSEDSSTYRDDFSVSLTDKSQVDRQDSSEESFVSMRPVMARTASGSSSVVYPGGAHSRSAVSSMSIQTGSQKDASFRW